MYEIIKEQGKAYVAKTKLFNVFKGFVISLGNINICIADTESGLEVCKIECQTSGVFPTLMGGAEVYVTAKEKEKKAYVFIKRGQFIVYTAYGKYQTQEELDFFLACCAEYGIQEKNNFI